MLCLCGLIYSHIVSEGQIEQLGNLTRNVLEHSVNVETALFKIQSLPGDQTLELIQGTSLMYSEPDAIEKSVKEVLLDRGELVDLLENVAFSFRDGSLSENLEKVREALGRFNEAVDKSTGLLLKGQRAEGMDVLMNRCIHLESGVVSAVGKLQSACISLQSAKLEETRKLDSERIARQRRILVWLIAGVLAAGISFVITIWTRSIGQVPSEPLKS
jgi:hypothetical protein